MGCDALGGRRKLKAFVWVFLSSALFGFAIALTYWFVAHEETTGTTLLAIMTAALLVPAAYAVLAEREAALEGDDPRATAGENDDLGIFTTRSAWPIVVAFCAVPIVLGLLWSPLLFAAGFGGLILCLWRLGAESARA